MRCLTLLFLLTCGGCATWSEAQLRLAEQLDRGVELCRQSHGQRAQLSIHHHDLQRAALDRAFDDDVRARTDLSAAWVIDHRKAYAVAVDALARQRVAALEAQRVDERNLEAMSLAIQRLRELQAAQLRLFTAIRPDPPAAHP